MSSPAFDRTSRVVALFLLLVTVWTASHRRPDDDGCLPVVAGEHDASKHAYAPPGSADHEHCAICHWMRGLKPAFASGTVASATLRPADSLAPLPVAVQLGSALGRLPARAPPSLL